MPEKNTKVVSNYDGEQGYAYEKKLCKLGAKITDIVPHKLFGVKTTDHEYWGLREVLTEPMIDVLLLMKQRKHYTFEEMLALTKKLKMSPVELQKLLDEMSVVGIMRCATFADWFLSLSNRHLSILHAFS